MTRGHGTHENRYILEIDGFDQILSSECTMGDKEHTPFELMVGNNPDAMLGRGTRKTADTTFKHAHGLNNVAQAFSQWLDDFADGVDLERRNGRMIVMDEDGVTPMNEYELQQIIPRTFKPETHSASGTGASMFTCAIRAEKMVAL